ncbi:MAG: hypothetical protein V3S39_00975, partial [Thermodesulfobacteriota bacterium]
VVETSQGPYVICGDAAIIRENLVGDPARHVPYTMIGQISSYLLDSGHQTNTTTLAKSDSYGNCQF